MLEPPRPLGVLPGPLEPQGGDHVGEAVDDEEHLPGPAGAGAAGAALGAAAVVLAEAADRVHGEADVGAACSGGKKEENTGLVGVMNKSLFSSRRHL